MDATPIDSGRYGSEGDALALADSLPATGYPAGALTRKWSALHDAAAVVGGIAGLESEPLPPDLRDFPLLLRDAPDWRRELARQGIEDLTAIMEPGLSALLAAHARGVDPVAAARALWREFVAARDAVLALAPPPVR